MVREVRKYKKEIVIIFLFSILVMLPYFVLPYCHGHDTSFHIINITAIAKSIHFPQFLVQIPLPLIGNNFGYGTRFFYPPIPHLMAAYLAHIFGNNVLLGMRLTQLITLFCSGLGAFFLIEKLFGNKKISLFASFAYMVTPYHLSQIFTRDAFSEMFFTVSAPIILLGLLYLIEGNKKYFYLCFVGGYTLAIFSHIAMSIYFTFLVLLTFFTVYYKKIFTKKNIILLCKAAVFILLLTASFWLPLLDLKLNGDYGVFIPYHMVGKGTLKNSALSIHELFNFTKNMSFSNIRYYSNSFIIILSIISLYYIFKNKMWKEKSTQFIIVFVIVSMIIVSKLFPWSYVPDSLAALQFPFRLTINFSLGMIILSCISLTKLKTKKYFTLGIVVLSILCLVSSYRVIHYYSPREVKIEEITYDKGLGNQNEYLPRNTLENLDYFNNRSQDIIVTEGQGTIKINSNEVPNLTFTATIEEPVVIELPRIYYFGYKLSNNQEEIELQESQYGFLEAKLTTSGKYELTFAKTPLMKSSLIVSIVTAIFSVIYLVKKPKKD